jgi:hypothetical protein
VNPAGARPAERGVSLLFAIALVLALTVIGAAVIGYAGRDRVAAAKMSVQERGVACADAGIQYGRRYFGCIYKRTSNWNDILSGAAPGRYDPSLGDAYPASLSAIPAVLEGDSSGSGKLDPGTDLDGTGRPSFWVSIRDDDDERPLGAPDNRTRDNNLAVILRSECINPQWAAEQGGQKRTSVVEVLLVYMADTKNPYAIASSSSNFPQASAAGVAVVTTLPSTQCDIGAPGSAF